MAFNREFARLKRPKKSNPFQYRLEGGPILGGEGEGGGVKPDFFSLFSGRWAYKWGGGS